MEKDFFSTKVSCEFAVITHDADCHIVTKELCLEPDRFFNKNDKIISKYSPNAGYCPHGLWAIKSESTIAEDIDISSHIAYFQNILANKLASIKRLKQYYKFECVFSMAIATDDAGVGIDFSESEMDFIRKISTRLSISFISKENL